MSGRPDDAASPRTGIPPATLAADRAAMGSRGEPTQATFATDQAEIGSPGEPTPTAAYERLAELAEAELAACEAERPEDLADLYEEAEAIRASLPPSPPAEAEPALRRAAAAQERIGHLLDARLAERGGDLQRVHRAREAARAYATTANARATA